MEGMDKGNIKASVAKEMGYYVAESNIRTRLSVARSASTA